MPQDGLRLTDSLGDDGSPILALEGEIDFGNVSELRTKLAEVIGRRPGDLTIDFDGVTFLDSTAIGVLIQAKKRLAQRNDELIVAGVRGRVLRIFEMAGLTDYLGV